MIIHILPHLRTYICNHYYLTYYYFILPFFSFAILLLSIALNHLIILHVLPSTICSMLCSHLSTFSHSSIRCFSIPNYFSHNLHLLPFSFNQYLFYSSTLPPLAFAINLWLSLLSFFVRYSSLL